tara:strand:+ start:815 stop:1072 length:258 start_codon:yes stop_codon:yes gene_type:complete
MALSDKEILDIAMRNSYRVLFEDANAEEIIESKNYYFAHNPFTPYSREFLLHMLDFFIHEEEYEKCLLINLMIKEWNSDHTKKKL